MDKLLDDIEDFVVWVLDLIRLVIGIVLFILIYVFFMLPTLIVMKHLEGVKVSNEYKKGQTK